MNRYAAVAVALQCAAWGSTAHAQVAPAAPETLAIGDWRLSPVVEVRMRGEVRGDLDGVERNVLTERARLGVDARYGIAEVRVVLQDARALASDTGATYAGPPVQAMTGAYEAWGQVAIGLRPSFVRVGRQAIVWGEGRLLGAAEWSPAGRSLDAVRARWTFGNAAVEGLAAALEDPPTLAASVPDLYGELAGLRAELAVDPLLDLEAYGLARIAQHSPVTPGQGVGDTVGGDTYVGALRAGGDGDAWAWGAEAAYELGRVVGLGVHRNAWAAAGHVEHRFDEVAWRPALRVGGSYASGGSGSRSYETFDPILPDVHAWQGAMDLFAWSNEAEVTARTLAAPHVDTTVGVEYRYARLADASAPWVSGYLLPIGGLPGNRDAELGHEVDAFATWSPLAPLELAAGYSLFVLGTGARAIVGAVGGGAPAQLSHYGNLQAHLTF